MKVNPFTNALAIIGYVGCVVLLLQFIQSVRRDTPDTLIDGLGFISLFVFSAAVMVFLFFYQPVLLLLQGKQTEAVTYFLKTLGVFGLITLVLFVFVSLQ